MRPLTEEETTVLFEKLNKYVGDNLNHIIERPDGPYFFRLSKSKVFYVREDVLLRASNVGKKELHSFGTCIGNFTKGGKFMVQITALDILAQFATHKMWLKPNAEQTFLYGNDVSKSGLGKMTENIEQHQGVVVYSLNDVPLGFAIAARSSQGCKAAEPGACVAFHQADIGEYIRQEEELF